MTVTLKSSVLDVDICETGDAGSRRHFRVDDQVLAMVISGFASAPNTELNLNTSAELNYVGLGNSELAHDSKIQAFVVDNKGKLLKNKQINTIKIPVKTKLEVKIQDWNTLDVSVRALKTQ